jgi:phosphohistidine phosphatase
VNLYILRHAIAVDAGTPGIENDSQRPLTQEGAVKMRSIARGMQKMDMQLDLILSSPYVRARQTAEIVANEFKLKGEFHVNSALVPGAPEGKIIAEITKRYPLKNNILLVGHEPSLSALIAKLLSSDSTLSITMKKGGLCRLNVDSLAYNRCATLEWLLYPFQLVELGK